MTESDEGHVLSHVDIYYEPDTVCFVTESFELLILLFIFIYLFFLDPLPLFLLLIVILLLNRLTIV